MIISGVTLSNIDVYDATIFTNDLDIYIDADSAVSYPGTGTSVFDLSGNGRTQTLTSAAAYTVLSGVKCFDFTTTNYMTANVTGPVLSTSGFTYIMWVRLLASTAGYRTFLRADPKDHAIIVNTGTNDLGMYDNDANAFFSAGYNVASLADVWAQWVVTGSSAGQTFYVNGAQVGTTVQTAAGNSHRWTGNAPPGAQPPGYVANMFLYNQIISADRIRQNYYALRGRFGV